MLIATKPRHKALNNAAENFKLEILGSELDVVTKTRYLCVQVDNSYNNNNNNNNTNLYTGLKHFNLKAVITVCPV